jgi:hypothetical protein
MKRLWGGRGFDATPMNTPREPQRFQILISKTQSTWEKGSSYERQTKSGWGGAREGAGRPKKSTSVRQLNAMLKKERKWAKKTGFDVDDFLLAVIGADTELLGLKEIPLRDRLTAANLWKQYTMPTVSEQNISVTDYPGPYIGLPPMMPDPALEVVNGGGKNPSE